MIDHKRLKEMADRAEAQDSTIVEYLKKRQPKVPTGRRVMRINPPARFMSLYQASRAVGTYSMKIWRAARFGKPIEGQIWCFATIKWKPVPFKKPPVQKSLWPKGYRPPGAQPPFKIGFDPRRYIRPRKCG
jgi:hypothetical protein